MSKQDWGSGSVYLRGQIWWISYPCNGRQIKESAKTEIESKARKLLRKRLTEVATTGIVSPRADKVVVGELLDDLLADYEDNGKSVAWAKIVVAHLRPHFGMRRAAAVNSSTVDAYIAIRRACGIANSTINRELSILRRAFTLGTQCEPPKVLRPPRIKKFEENNVRKGFFEASEFEAIMEHLDADVAPVARLAYLTGCRRGEILGLQWSQFDDANGLIRLHPGETKNDDSRVIPLTPELHAQLRALKATRDESWPWARFIFTRAGQRIRDFRGAWARACEAAGVEDRIFHDFRRTGVRNLVRAGVPEVVAMKISGHRTRAVFDRYNIVSEDDLKAAAKKLSDHLKLKRKKK